MKSFFSFHLYTLLHVFQEPNSAYQTLSQYLFILCIPFACVVFCLFVFLTESGDFSQVFLPVRQTLSQPMYLPSLRASFRKAPVSAILSDLNPTISRSLINTLRKWLFYCYFVFQMGRFSLFLSLGFSPRKKVLERPGRKWGDIFLSVFYLEARAYFIPHMTADLTI